MKRKVEGAVRANRVIIKVRISLMIGAAQARSSTGRTSQKKCSISELQNGSPKMATA